MALFGGIEIPGHPDLENIRRLDLLPMPQIRRMMRMGIAIDPPWLNDLSSRLRGRQVELQKDIASYIPPEALDQFVGDSGDEIGINVDSAQQIAELLFKLLRIGRDRAVRLKRTPSGDRISTGKKQLETLKREHPVVPLILEYRECAKLDNTYCSKLPLMARMHNRGECSVCGLWHDMAHPRIHCEILTTRAATGRLQCKNPNLFNIPARTKQGREVRAGFVPAPDGTRRKALVGRDLAQIELRLLADRARESNMIRIFQNGGDIHADTAMRAFEKTLAEVTSKEGKLLYRAPCKNVNFGIVYRLSAAGLYDLMAVTYATAGMSLPEWLTLEWCEGFIAKWFGLYPEAQAYFDLLDYRAYRYNIEWCMFGRVRRIPEVNSLHERVQAAGLRQAGNMPIQAGNAGVLKIAMARIERRFGQLRSQGIHVEALLPIYDEVLAEVDYDWAEEVGEIMGWEMEQALVDEETKELRFRVPVLSDGKVMDRWVKD